MIYVLHLVEVGEQVLLGVIAEAAAFAILEAILVVFDGDTR